MEVEVEIDLEIILLYVSKNSVIRSDFVEKDVSLQRQTTKDEALYTTSPSVAMD